MGVYEPQDELSLSEFIEKYGYVLGIGLAVGVLVLLRQLIAQRAPEPSLVLNEASLEGSRMSAMNLRDAVFQRSILQNTDFSYADLSGAVLHGSDLRGANFAEANLENATIRENLLNERTVLPDGTHWSTAADMRRFTHPRHPEFWRSNNSHSPAYSNGR
ncbi:MAG: pentapeptide repeat-containing protein [Burkholderiales bacterium]|nr:pentapeptide repeat-containing protein [Anaerolineae bacterium]